MRITKFADRRETAWRTAWRTADGGPTEKFCSPKITFLSIKSSHSSRTSIKKFGFSVHKINTFITIVNRKKKYVMYYYVKSGSTIKDFSLIKFKKYVRACM
jgi:hypothetical protein